MGEAKFRLWNPQWHNCTNMIPVRKDKHGHYPMVFDIEISEAASAAAEIGTAADNALNGSTTPVILYVASTSATDKDAAAGAVRRIHIIGISVASSKNYVLGTEDPVYSVEEVALDSADGTTDVTTSRYYLRVMHAYAVLWGTGGAASHDAEGNITVADDDVPTTTYLTIDAADNESNNSGLIYLAANYEGRWTRCFVSLNDSALNQA